MFTVGSALTRMTQQQGDKTALIFGDRSLSFVQLNQQANRIAWALHHEGLQAKDRIALLLPNGLEMVACYFGIAKAGMMAVPLNVRWTPPELEYALLDAGASVLITAREFEPLLATSKLSPCRVHYVEESGIWNDDRIDATITEPNFASVSEWDDWLIVYTSGTTGRPKGAVRNHLSTLLVALALVTELGITSDQIGFAILPLFHVNSMLFVLLSVAIGATCVIYPKRVPHPKDMLEQMIAHRVNYAMLVPSLLTVMADAMQSLDVSQLRLDILLSSSAPMPAILRDRIITSLPRTRLYDVYGSTEYGAATLYRHVFQGPEGAVGYPVMGLNLQILDELREPVATGRVGEVYVRGLSVVSGYWENPVANTENFTTDGYLSVGDMGYISEAGLLYLVDRKQDLILVAGENVYPSEVEAVLWNHPAVELVTVFGVPDALYGERVIAMVKPKSGEVLSKEALSILCKRQLADYKIPYRIIVVASLPVGPAGKVIRRQAKILYLNRAYDLIS